MQTGPPVPITAAQLAQTQFQAGSGTDTLYVPRQQRVDAVASVEDGLLAFASDANDVDLCSGHAVLARSPPSL